MSQEKKENEKEKRTQPSDEAQKRAIRFLLTCEYVMKDNEKSKDSGKK